MSKKKCCKSKKPCKDCPRNKKKKISAVHAADKPAESCDSRGGVIAISVWHGEYL